MTEQPNIKRELLEWALEQWDGDGCIHFREFADENDYSRRRVGKKVAETGAFDWGTSPMGAWPRKHEVESLRQALDEVTP